ncbi:hypothetical protein ACFWPQ_35495 [Streptomyces sp. NPDC058464]|uniref:hypothetical protein n=1 Tax=Streptomyces sp. NPDC058464 TaxID=3346511 RepID=UPI00365FE459
MLQTPTEEHTECPNASETAAIDATPTGTETCRVLCFQRCLWCLTPDYRRSFCRVCGSRAFGRERSAGAGGVVRRVGHKPHNTWLVAMDEGFTVVCQVVSAAPVVVAIGARVRVVRAVAPLDRGLPRVELTYRATSSARWW